jgi:hypothetical protein
MLIKLVGSKLWWQDDKQHEILIKQKRYVRIHALLDITKLYYHLNVDVRSNLRAKKIYYYYYVVDYSNRSL